MSVWNIRSFRRENFQLFSSPQFLSRSLSSLISLTGPCGCTEGMIEMKRNERVKQCTVIDEMESNYVNVDSLWSSNHFYLLISVWKPVQPRCWIRNSCTNEPRGMFLILELSLCRIVMNFPKSVFKCAIRKVVLLPENLESNVCHQNV